MTDKEEWSLKGKDVDMVRVTDDKEDTFGYPAYSLDMLYSAKDIETLRQKLIEDLKQYEKENIDTIRQSRLFAVMLNDIVEIINKRFGVNHD